PVSRAGGPAAATSYRLYVSRDGKGFGKLADVAATSYTIPATDLDGDAYYFRVAAINAGGESPMSYAVGARTNGAGGGGGTNRILIVNGFDRFDRTGNVRSTYLPAPDDLTDRVRPLLNNTFNYVTAAGEAIEAYTAGGVSLGFDSVQNEHVTAGLLGQYRTVVWLSGEESTADESFNAAEQTAVSSFVGGGGTLFVSGSEVGWDLDGSAGATAADRSFYNNTLKADYLSDDANTYNATAAAGSIFAGMSSLAFNSQNTVYNVDFPDVLGTSGGSTAALNYSGGTGGIAATQWASAAAGSGGARVVNMGFPFETITADARRNDVMARVLSFFQTAVSETTGIPDLVATSDTGNSDTDNITNLDNTPGKTLQFDVSGTVAGAIVRLFADGIQIGTATGAAGTTRVTTSGSADLVDGAHVITARQEESGKSVSAASAALGVIVDTVGPAITGYLVNDGAPQRSRVTSLTVTFDQRVSFASDSFTLTRRSDDLGLTPTAANPSGDGSTWVLSFSGTGTDFGSLADGIWDLNVDSSTVFDISGNNQTADGTFVLHRLFGDGNGDGDVDNANLFEFRSTQGKFTSDPGFLWYYDFAGDGDVDNADLFQFRARTTITFSY
ncbi:MAG: Ig-like domain-containing protein, partial [Planctomycetota bacterium]|nr:Ig-like domain-containing protein [Planctomycetota bacterium]